MRLLDGALLGLHRRHTGVSDLGAVWAILRLLRYVATGHQHRDDRPDVSGCLPDPEQPEPGIEKAVQLKLDELIRAVGDANDTLIDIEETTDDELDALKELYRAKAQRIRPNGNEPPIDANGGRANAAM
jgi:hypothetical protein